MEKDILKQLYQKYRKEIYLYLYSLCKNSSLAEDLLQETFLKALLSLPDDHTNMRAWLYLVARNLFFNYYRREKEKVPLGEVQQIQNTASQEVLEGILKEEKNRLLYQAMGDSADAVFWRTVTERDCGDLKNDTGKCTGTVISGKA